MKETARGKAAVPALCGRRKQLWMSALSLLLILCLTACGGPEGGKGGKPSPESPDSGAISSTPPAELSADTLGGTYWTAVQHESYDDLYGRTNVSQMPTDKWWADLFLNEDRTTQFREVLGDTFNLYLTDGLWSLEADGTLHLTDAGGNRDYDMAGRFEEGRLILETAYGDIFYLEQAERPEPGGELCPANLAGTWRMTGLEENGRLSDARENGVASILLFSSLWSELDGGRYTLQADYYFASSLDTQEPEYRQASGLLLKPLDRPLMDGISNEVWSAQLLEESTGQELFVTLTDPDTLYLQEHDQRNGAPTVRTAVYEREYSFFPEILQLALYEEPSDSLIFYWTNPPEEVCTPLEAMAVTKLEEKGLDRLLLVGCWYETQIQFCTGEGVWDEDGILLDWVTDETLYDGIIGIDEPLWFSLTIPEGVPNLCLHMKRPWDDSWYLWPITNTDGYLVNGWTFLTS